MILYYTVSRCLCNSRLYGNYEEYYGSNGGKKSQKCVLEHVRVYTANHFIDANMGRNTIIAAPSQNLSDGDEDGS